MKNTVAHFHWVWWAVRMWKRRAYLSFSWLEHQIHFSQNGIWWGRFRLVKAIERDQELKMQMLEDASEWTIPPSPPQAKLNELKDPSKKRNNDTCIGHWLGIVFLFPFQNIAVAIASWSPTQTNQLLTSKPIFLHRDREFKTKSSHLSSCTQDLTLKKRRGKNCPIQSCACPSRTLLTLKWKGTAPLRTECVFVCFLSSHSYFSATYDWSFFAFFL